jgi:hypothetical protein
MDPSGIPTTESSKQRSAAPDGVSFVNNPSLKDSPDLVAFISSQTGKMRALANADLESHIELIQQFLNIGKTYEFEGIGTIVKKKGGVYEFIALSAPPEKVKEYKVKETSGHSKQEEVIKSPPKAPKAPKEKKDYDSFLATPKVSFGWRRPVMAFLVLCGIGLAIWGGYTISKNAAADDATEVLAPVTTAPPPVIDSTAIKAALAKSKDYKYILQVSQKQTAIRRYNQLRTNLWDVKMETNDSVQYKLFLLLPSNTDTTRILDSLSAFTGKKVYIEHDN